MSVNKKPFKEAYFFHPLTAKEKERKKCFTTGGKYCKGK